MTDEYGCIVKKKVAVVTGGGGDIGHHICETLVRANYEVISLDMVPSDSSITSLEYLE